MLIVYRSSRQRAFCCTPASGKSPFLPVPLDYLFPNPPASDVADPVFNLEVDDSWGTGKAEGKDDPNVSLHTIFIVILSLNPMDDTRMQLLDLS